jgi:hypothetical protein
MDLDRSLYPQATNQREEMDRYGTYQRTMLLWCWQPGRVRGPRQPPGAHLPTRPDLGGRGPHWGRRCGVRLPVARELAGRGGACVDG